MSEEMGEAAAAAAKVVKVVCLGLLLLYIIKNVFVLYKNVCIRRNMNHYLLFFKSYEMCFIRTCGFEYCPDGAAVDNVLYIYIY